MEKKCWKPAFPFLRFSQCLPYLYKQIFKFESHLFCRMQILANMASLKFCRVTLIWKQIHDTKESWWLYDPRSGKKQVKCFCLLDYTRPLSHCHYGSIKNLFCLPSYWIMSSKPALGFVQKKKKKLTNVNRFWPMSDWLVFNAVFNVSSFLSQRPLNLSILSWNSFYQDYAQYSLQATGCFPTMREERILSSIRPC